MGPLGWQNELITIPEFKIIASFLQASINHQPLNRRACFNKLSLTLDKP